MIRRTTLAAEADDLDLLQREARRRGLSLAQVLKEIVHDAADERRAASPRPHFGIFSGSGKSVAHETVDDEDSPARGRLRS